MTFYVMASGSGLISGTANAFNSFNVYTGITGIGGLKVQIDGPSRCNIKYTDNHNGSVQVSYMPFITGTYKITIRFDGVQIQGSPFTVKIRSNDQRRYTAHHGAYNFITSRVKTSGRGLMSGLSCVKNEIIVDTRDCAPGRVTWSIEGPGHVESSHSFYNGVYRIYYIPDVPGEYIIRIKHAERDVPSSPFKVRVM